MMEEEAVRHDRRAAHLGDTFAGFLVVHNLFCTPVLVCVAEGEMYL